MRSESLKAGKNKDERCFADGKLLEIKRVTKTTFNLYFDSVVKQRSSVTSRLLTKMRAGRDA